MGHRKKKAEAAASYQTEHRHSKMLDLPPILQNTFYLEMTGNQEATLIGCTGIQEYGEGVITIGAGKKSVRFCGNIQIRSMSEDSIVLEGDLQSVTFLSSTTQKP